MTTPTIEQQLDAIPEVLRDIIGFTCSRHWTAENERRYALGCNDCACDKRRVSALLRLLAKERTDTAVVIRGRLANQKTNTPAWAGGVEVVNEYIEENEAELAQLTTQGEEKP